MEEKDVEQLFCRATKMGRQTEREKQEETDGPGSHRQKVTDRNRLTRRDRQEEMNRKRPDLQEDTKQKDRVTKCMWQLKYTA